MSRLLQVTPSILFCDSDAAYKGKRQPVLPKVEQILGRLKKQPQVFVIPVRLPVTKYSPISDFMAKAIPSDKLESQRVSFSHPLVICYSSGTTGLGHVVNAMASTNKL